MTSFPTTLARHTLRMCEFCQIGPDTDKAMACLKITALHLNTVSQNVLKLITRSNIFVQIGENLTIFYTTC